MELDRDLEEELARARTPLELDGALRKILARTGRAAGSGYGDLVHAGLPDIVTFQDFTRWLQLLIAYLKHEPDRWSNPHLQLFLEAMAAWGQADPMDVEEQARANPWRAFAEMMHAATMYD